MSRFKAITRTVWILSFVSLFNDISSELLYPVMPVYLKSIGFSVFMIGLLEGIAEAVAGLSKGYFGNLSDHKGKRLPFVQLGYGLSAVARLLLALFQSVGPVFLSRLTDRMGKGIRTSARDAVLSAESPPGRKAEVFGFHRSMDTIGAAIGPLVALIYLYYHPQSYRTLFIISFIPVTVSTLLTFLMKEKQAVKTNARKNAPGFFSFLSYWKKSNLSYRQLVSILVLFTIFNSADAFLLLMLKQMGYSDTAMIGVYIYYNLIYALVAMPIGRMADRLGIKKIMVAGIFFFAVAYGGISFAGSLPLMIVIFTVYAFFPACVESTSKALITNTCKTEDTATALGFYNSFNSIGLLVASSWTGWLWMKAGPSVPLMISSAGAIICAILLMTIRSGDQQLEKKENITS